MPVKTKRTEMLRQQQSNAFLIVDMRSIITRRMYDYNSMSLSARQLTIHTKVRRRFCYALLSRKDIKFHDK